MILEVIPNDSVKSGFMMIIDSSPNLTQLFRRFYHEKVNPP